MSKIAKRKPKAKQTGELAKKRKSPKRVRIGADEGLRPREVELMRDLYEHQFWAIAQLAKKFEVSQARAQSIVTYKTHR